MLGGSVEGRNFSGPVWSTAYLGHGKVFIIDEAELLDHVGQNALLKTMEEPPPNTWIVLVTTREDRLLPTIRSRCQLVGFSPLDTASMSKWIAQWASTQSGSALDQIALRWISRFAEGSPGLASDAGRFNVHGLASDLEKPLAEISNGRFVVGLSERMSQFTTDCADAVVKDNVKASKEAANRLGARLLFGVLSQYLRDAMLKAAQAHDLGLVERWTMIADVLDAADEEIRRSLNQKQVLANLVAQWVLHAPQRTAEVDC